MHFLKGACSIFLNFQINFFNSYPLKAMKKLIYPKTRDVNLQFEVSLNFLSKCPKRLCPCKKCQFWPEWHVWPHFARRGNILPWIWPQKWFPQLFLSIKHLVWQWQTVALIKKNCPKIDPRPLFRGKVWRRPTKMGNELPYSNHHEKSVTSMYKHVLKV